MPPFLAYAPVSTLSFRLKALPVSFIVEDASECGLMGTGFLKSVYQRQGDLAFVEIFAEAFGFDVLLLLGSCMCIDIDHVD